MLLNFSDETRSDMDAPSRLLQRDGIGIDEQRSIIGFNRVPPDHNGAVGPDHVVSVLNHAMQIYDKDGALLATQQLENLFGVLGGTSTLPVDPNILFDVESQRFVFVSFEVLGTTNGPINTSDDQVFLNVAVSKTSDPLDGWHVTSIDAKTIIGGQNTWSDYPGVAVDDGAIYITANMFDFDAGADGTRQFKGNRLWIVEKGDGAGGLYDGGAVSFSVHDPIASATDISGLGVTAATLMPARYAGDQSGQSGIYLVTTSGLSNGVNELAQVIHVTNPLNAPQFVAQTVSLGDISNENLNFLPAATQLGTPIRLGSGDARVNSGAAVVWNDQLFFTWSVSPKTGPDAGQITTHWTQLDATNPNLLALVQQGDVGGEDIAPGTHTFHSSINVNKDGAVLINFSASGTNIYPGAYYVVRGPDDPNGQVGPAQTISAGSDWYFRNRSGEGISSQTTNRWGDFSGVSVDPEDGTTFWFFNQVAEKRGSPNGAGQDGRWRVVLGAARPTINNFQFTEGSSDEAFFGGPGADGLELSSSLPQSSITVAPDIDDVVRISFSTGSVASISFIEYLLFRGGAGADSVVISGDFSQSSLVNGAIIIDGEGGDDTFSSFLLTSYVRASFSGGPGNDDLRGGLGRDTLLGGLGADILNGNAANDFLVGGDDSDTLFGGSGADTLVGGVGADTLAGGDGADSLAGQEGDDAMFGGAGNDTVVGGDGADLMTGVGGNDQLFGGLGIDTLFGGVQADTLSGGDDNDEVYGNQGADELFGGGGNDFVDGGDGDDLVTGQDGDDQLFGGIGDDTVFGGTGNDTIAGGNGFDSLSGNAGLDQLFGGNDADTIDGGNDADTVSGAGGNDSITGGTANDLLFGSAGNDTVAGGSGSDTIDGGADDDLLFGGADGDRLIGGAGDDTLSGVDGNDTFVGGAGDDTMFGGAGDDSFIFTAGVDGETIADFTVGAGSEDVITLNGFGAAFDAFSDVQAAA
ncbi:MAG: calcium-binding protein, partial [Pseudomonadota bacterium]